MSNRNRRRFQCAAVVAAGLVATAGLSLYAQTAGNSNEGADFAPKAPIQAQTAEEEAKSFVLPPGYRMELVLSDPDIVAPAVIEFDGDGRMYVAEFRSYMPDVEGSDQRAPVNRISRWEDTNGDGTYDTHTVFVDHLVLPRMILPLDHDSILTNETDSDDVVKWTDTDGDGVADTHEVFFSGVGLNRDGNLEHEQSGFVWGLDNWIYSTYNAFRFRWTPHGILREPTGSNGGQWGLSMDDDGKMWFVCAGCERGPLNFQVPIEYGAFRISPHPATANGPANTFDEYEPGFDVVWPIEGLGDMQGGMGRVRMPLGVLNHATATAGPDIVRGDRVPDDLKGDLLFVEPVGRLIRRAKIVKVDTVILTTKDGKTVRGGLVGESPVSIELQPWDAEGTVTIRKDDIATRSTEPTGLTQLRNAYPGSEFILSRDPLFRPVNLRTAPDGTVYIADMYRGIIQEAQWTGPGSYLRHKILQYQLDKLVGHGRIWRLRFDGTAAVPETPNGPAARALPGVPAEPAIPLDFTKPRMLEETPAELVTHLTNPNGWWRDTAQQLLVQRQDKSVVPALQHMARTSDSLVGRFHALWTLEGLGALDAGLVREAMADANPRMRIQAIRASETLYKAGDKSFADDYRRLAKDADVDVSLQALLTLNTLKVDGADDVIKATMAANQAWGIQQIGTMLLNPPGRGRGGFGPGVTPEQQALLQRGETVFNELCFSCHGSDGRGAPLAGAPAGTTMAPPLAGSPRVQGHRDYIIRVLLHGLTGPVGDRNYTEVMVPMGSQDDAWIASVASYVRNSFGNSASFVSPADVARVRAASTNRKTSWTVPEIEALLPTLAPAQPTWKVTASHNSDTAANALTLTGWNSGEPEAAGMWLQVELPQPIALAEVQFNVPAGRGFGGARGRGGRGAPVPGGRGAGEAPAARTYQIQVSMDGQSWGRAVGTGTIGTLNEVAFTPVRAKFVRITETAAPTGTAPLRIENVRLLEAPAGNGGRQ
jgi:mono/diheme cytochrome c family protein